MKAVLLLIALLVAAASAIPRTSNCETNDDCDTGSCCVPMRRFYIMSKRAVVAKKIAIKDRMSGGRCVKYVKENGSCHMLGFAACGCEPGTKCKYYPEEAKKLAVKTAVKKTEIGKRKMIYRPGKSICEKP